MRNHSSVTTFILLGLTNDPQLEIVVFIFLFLAYLFSVVGNLAIMVLILVDPHLKTAMYFFLQNFSFLELSFTTSCVPAYLHTILSGDKTISLEACFIQIFFIDVIGSTDFFLLAVMSYDRYVAICKPLHYVTIMNRRVCRNLILCCWASGLLVVSPPLGHGLLLEFCGSVINHYYCDASPLLKNSCSDTSLIEQMVVASAVLIFITTLVGMAVSYTCIIRTILKLPSVQQRKKAFSTCSSHLIVVSLSYGSCIFMYIKPSAKDDVDINKVVSLLFYIYCPLVESLNLHPEK
ncbi:olfactory receptor 6C68-like [Sorex araneus]|uniref:olfactory receptor 6C68-like n=1 Tax=Sorex araneus TaxID=42254 RepID=UPI002433D55C|nr:olfactory receptor 6C68-like [Sorex araneus]